MIVLSLILMRGVVKRTGDDLRADYDLSQLKGGVRGKYYRQATAGTNLVLVRAELAEVFRTPSRSTAHCGSWRTPLKQPLGGRVCGVERRTRGSSGPLERRGRLAARR